MIHVHNLGTVGSVLYLAISNAASPFRYALLAIDTALFTSAIGLPIIGDQLALEECKRVAWKAGAR